VAQAYAAALHGHPLARVHACPKHVVDPVHPKVRDGGIAKVFDQRKRGRHPGVSC
jgi:hypothetical protein